MNLLQNLKIQLLISNATMRRILQIWTPHPGSVLFTLVVVGLVLCASDVNAFPLRQSIPSQVTLSETITYQGYLTDRKNNNEPLVAKGIAMTFNLYEEPKGGIPIWHDTYRVDVVDGVFQVELGSDQINRLPLSIVSNQNSIWLGIEIAGDEEMVPRQQLTSVLRAVNANQLGGIAASEFITQTMFLDTLLESGGKG